MQITERQIHKLTEYAKSLGLSCVARQGAYIDPYKRSDVVTIVVYPRDSQPIIHENTIAELWESHALAG